MARFDVYRVKNRAGALVVDVQSDLLEDLTSRVVIPLAPVEPDRAEALPRLKPSLVVDGVEYTLLTTDIAARPTSRFGERVGNVEDRYRDVIVAAMDFLFQGF